MIEGLARLWDSVARVQKEINQRESLKGVDQKRSNGFVVCLGEAFVAVADGGVIHRAPVMGVAHSRKKFTVGGADDRPSGICSIARWRAFSFVQGPSRRWTGPALVRRKTNDQSNKQQVWSGKGTMP